MKQLGKLVSLVVLVVVTTILAFTAGKNRGPVRIVKEKVEIEVEGVLTRERVELWCSIYDMRIMTKKELEDIKATQHLGGLKEGRKSCY